MDPKQLLEVIIRPTLLEIGLYSRSAEILVFATACQESNLRYLQQLGGGPAIGIYQMEPETHEDIWDNFLAYRPELAERISRVEIPTWYEGNDYREMAGNLYYATAMCRVHYYRVPEELPDAQDISGLAQYWKQHYNTHLGAGTMDEFIDNYLRHL